MITHAQPVVATEPENENGEEENRAWTLIHTHLRLNSDSLPGGGFP